MSDWVPVVIAQTYNPKWVRSDGQTVYAATLFFTVTFTDQPTQLVFQRSRLDRIALWVSLCTLVGLLVAVLTTKTRRHKEKK